MNGWRLAARLARRELRAGLGGFRILVACLALGVGTIAAVGSLSQSVTAGLDADARNLLGGDVDLRLSGRAPDAAQQAYIDANSLRHSRIYEMRAMARPLDDRAPRTMVELKAVDAAYPLVGTVALDPAMPLAEALGRRDGTWGAAAAPELLRKLGVKIGDRLHLGELTVVLRATIRREPDNITNLFTLGPRLMIDAAALPATGLVVPGSQYQVHTRVTLPRGVAGAAWIESLHARFPQAGWRVRGLDKAAPGAERFIERMGLFLSFVGLTALLVGGIGVANAVRGYLDGKTATLATLKCLGAPADLVFRVYLLQILALAALGIGIGVVLGAAAPAGAVWALADLLPVRPRIGLYPEPLALAALFGLVIAVTFTLWPLARAREIPAASLFRDRIVPARARPRGRHLWVALGWILALAALTVATASRPAFAAWFVGGAVATLLVLRLGAAAVMALAGRVGVLQRPVLRLALTNIHRPGAATPTVVLSLGVGLSVLVAVALIQGNLTRQIDERLPAEAPAFFFIDIQPHQVAAFDAAVLGVAGTGDLQQRPTLRGRIVAINGVPVDQAHIDPGSAWAVRGDRALTYAAQAPQKADVVAGKWWPADYAGPPLISFDAGLARGFGVGVGDSLTLNILGRNVTARIANLRSIDWRSLRFDFAIIFAPGVLEHAPQTYLAAVHAPRAAEDAVERAVTDRFPNVSIVRVREALEEAARLLAGIGAAIRGTAAIDLLAGVLVLAGAIAAGRRRRIYDAVVFKVLGATRMTVLKAFILEYGLLGAATGLIAALVGSLTAWAVVTFVMNAEWVFLPSVVVTTLVACIAVTIGLGFVGTWRAMGQKAAPYLRNE